MPNERTPLLEDQEDEENPHRQFCALIGVPPSNLPPGAKFSPGRKTLYGRATSQRSRSNVSYQFMASISNTLLLSQVMIGAALTGLGASSSSHVLITVFAAMNTIIAGLVAYLKSRGQPMRARMYRDDLERVIDEIENSEIMWLGITQNFHGYDEIDIDETVTVRKEVARLTRLYNRAVRDHTMNDPDMYMAGGSGDGTATALRTRPVPTAGTVPPLGVPPPSSSIAPVDVPATLAQKPAPVVLDPDESPATAVPKPPPASAPADDKSTKDTASKDSSTPTPPDDKTSKDTASKDSPTSAPSDDKATKDTTANTSKDLTKEGPKDPPKETPKENPPETSKEPPTEAPKDADTVEASPSTNQQPAQNSTEQKPDDTTKSNGKESSDNST